MFKMSICVLLGGVLMTASAWAAPTLQVTRTPGYYYGAGGEFTLLPDAELEALTGQIGPFQSFCLEKNESVYLGSTYEVLLNTEALQGGLNYGPIGPAGGDALDPRTAYLYSRFRAGTLAGYDYTPGAGRSSSARALQEVVWYLEDEMARTWSEGSLQETLYMAAQQATDSGNWTGLGNVRVMNYYVPGHAGDLQYRRQDMLVTIAVVPTPGMSTLAGLGIFLVGSLHRRHLL